MIRFFREYQKYLFWTLVLLVLPTFSISFVMLDVITAPESEEAGTVFGEEIEPAEYQGFAQRLIGFYRFNGQSPSREYEAVWRHIVLLRKAEAVGVEVTDEAVAERVKRLYREIVAFERAYLEIQEDEQMQAFAAQVGERFLTSLAQQRATQLLPTVAFRGEDYAQRLERLELKPATFEMAVREQMMVERLLEAAESAVKVDPQSLYETYQREHHKRRARYVTFAGASFKPTRESATEEELKAYYDENQQRFAEPRRVELAYLLFPIADERAAQAEPSDDDLKAAYEKHKATRYKLADAPAPPGGAGEAPPPPAEPRYRPFEEVRGDLIRELTDERAKQAALAKAEALRKLLVDETQAGRRLALGGLAMEQGALFGTTGLIEPKQLIDVKPIRGDFLLAVKVNGQQPGDVSPAAANDDNAYFYVVAEKRDARDVPYEEVKAQVLDGFVDGHADDIRGYYNRNVAKYREPERLKVEALWKPHVRYREELPAELAGDERKKRLRELVQEDWESLQVASKRLGETGKPRDLEVVANERGWEYEQVETRLTGEDLPKDLGEATEDAVAWLAGARTKKDEFSGTFEDKDEKLAYGFKALGLSAPRTPPLAEIEAKVREDLRAERGKVRARKRAKEMAEQVALRPAAFEKEAERLGVAVKETGLLARGDDGKGLPGEGTFVARLFAIEDLGAASEADAVIEGEAEVTVLRFVAREAADPAGLEAKRAELEKRLLPVETFTQRERFVDQIRLEAHGLDDAAVRLGYDLLLGPGGLDAVGFRHLFVEADQESIEAALGAAAKARCEAVAADLRQGKIAFDLAAKQHSEDKDTKRQLGVVRNGSPLFEELNRLTRALKPGETSAPLETERGWHLVKVTDRGGRRIQHIQFNSKPERDPATNRLVGVPPAILAEAMAKAKGKVEEAVKRLEAGESFVPVAKAVSTGDGTWQETFYPYYTPLELAALELGAKLRAGAPAAELVSQPVELGDGAHLLFVSDLTLGEEKALAVSHIFRKGGSAAKDLASIREDIYEDLADDAEDTESASGERGRLAKLFREYAEEESEGPTAKKGGALGLVRGAPALERYGDALRDAVYALEPGQRSAIVEGADGYHVVLCTERRTQTYEKAWLDLAAMLLEVVSF